MKQPRRSRPPLIATETEVAAGTVTYKRGRSLRHDDPDETAGRALYRAIANAEANAQTATDRRRVKFREDQ